MSDYVRRKVIRLPFPNNIFTECKTKDDWECEDYLKEKFGSIWGKERGKKKYLEIESTDESYYLDYVFYSTYGEESGEFGFVRLLNDKEFNKVKPIFDLVTDYARDDLRLVDYCYYNGYDAPDYYDLSEEIDYSNEF